MKKGASYSEKLKDPRWQKKRLQVLDHAEWRCQMCGAKDRTLNVHHSYYTKGKEPWQYALGALIATCEPCHDVIHKTVKQKADYRVGEWKLMWVSAFVEPDPEAITERPIVHACGKDKFEALRKMLESP